MFQSCGKADPKEHVEIWYTQIFPCNTDTYQHCGTIFISKETCFLRQISPPLLQIAMKLEMK